VTTDRPYASPKAPLAHEPVRSPEPLLRLRIGTILLLAALAWMAISGKRYAVMDGSAHDSTAAHGAMLALNTATWYLLPALPFIALLVVVATLAVFVLQRRWRALPQQAVELAVALAANLLQLNYLSLMLLRLLGTG